MTSRGRRVAWVRVSGMNWLEETGKRPNRKERGGFIGAVCSCVLSSAASSLLRPGDPACAASRAGHPPSPPCSTTACAPPTFLSHLQLSQPWAKPGVQPLHPIPLPSISVAPPGRPRGGAPGPAYRPLSLWVPAHCLGQEPRRP